jgi:hypothetical protein
MMAMTANEDATWQRLLPAEWTWISQHTAGNYRLINFTDGTEIIGPPKAVVGYVYDAARDKHFYRAKVEDTIMDREFLTRDEAQEFCETFYKLKGELQWQR